MKKFNTQACSTHRIRLLFLASLLALLAACSSLRLTYNHGDTILYWWLNAYVDIDTDQKGWVKKAATWQ